MSFDYEGMTMPISIMTWNVNGLRSVINKKSFAILEDQLPDILCLQEIKTFPEKIDLKDTPFSNYQVAWHPAERSGYSGVATLYRIPPERYQIGLGEPVFDREGRSIFTYYPDFTLINVYVPSGQRDRGRVNYKLAFYKKLLEICDQLHDAGQRIVICGDFNTAHEEIDLRNPKSNQTTSGFLPEEREWIDHYLERGFIDAFRSLYPEKIQYTWWTYITNARQRNVGWRLDYFLVSKLLMPRVCDVVINENIFGSDHCPVTIILQ